MVSTALSTRCFPQQVLQLPTNGEPVLLTYPKARPQNLPEASLMLPFNDGRRWVGLSQIVRLEGVVNYTTCYFLDGSQLLVALSLRVLADRLPTGAFMRTHRKHLLNTQHIKTFLSVQSLVLLANGERIPVARRRVGAFRREWQQSH